MISRVRYVLEPMTTGRKLRLAFLASIVALLFGVVTIGHAGSHLGADNRIDSAASCAFCQHAPTTHTAPVIVSAPVLTIVAVFVPVSIALAVPSVRAHGNRGPPALL